MPVTVISLTQYACLLHWSCTHTLRYVCAAAAPVDKDEWLRGTYYDQQKKKTVVTKVTKKAE